jgi:hypothetical protein
VGGCARGCGREPNVSLAAPPATAGAAHVRQPSLRRFPSARGNRTANAREPGYPLDDALCATTRLSHRGVNALERVAVTCLFP